MTTFGGCVARTLLLLLLIAALVSSEGILVEARASGGSEIYPDIRQGYGFSNQRLGGPKGAADRIKFALRHYLSSGANHNNLFLSASPGYRPGSELAEEPSQSLAEEELHIQTRSGGEQQKGTNSFNFEWLPSGFDKLLVDDEFEASQKATRNVQPVIMRLPPRFGKRSC